MILYISDRLRFCVQRKEINKHLNKVRSHRSGDRYLEFEYNKKRSSSNRSDIQQLTNDADAGEMLFQSNCLAWHGMVDSARNPVLYKLHHLILVVMFDLTKFF